MPLISKSPTTITSNSSGITYIVGDENTNNSIRLIDDNGTPVFQKRINGVWNDSDLRVSGNSLHIGRDLSISAAGHHMVVSSKSGSGKFLLIPAPFSDSGTNEPEMPILNVKETRIITQSDNTNEIIGISFGYVVIPSESQIISRLYYQTGSIPASANIVLRAYFGTDNTGVMYLQKVIPASIWIANTEIQIDIPGFLNYIDGVSIYGELTSTESFSIKTNVTQDQPWRAADRWVMTHERISYAPAWSEKTWNKDNWCIENGKIYVCNMTGAQSGSFEANSNNWDLLSDLIAKVLNYKGAISVANFNALTSGAIGDQYKLSDSGTLVGDVIVNANDTVIIKTNFSSLITVNDYDHFADPSDIVLQTGRAGGQQIAGGTAINENLTLKSTEHATKGKIFIGNSAYDEANNNLGIGTTDLDGIPAIGKITVKGITSDGTSNIFVGRDSTETNVIEIDTDGNIKPTITNISNIGTSALVYKEVDVRKIYSDDNLTLDAITGKNVVIKKSILPDLSNTYSIGSSTKVIKEVFVETITSDGDLVLGATTGDIIFKNGNVSNGIITSTGDVGIGNINPTKKLEVTGDVFIDGALTVDGTVTQVNVTNLDVTNKNINLAVSETPTDTLANGGGIVLKGTTDKTILWDNSNVEWDISDGLDVDGIVKAKGISSDGSTNIFIGKDSLATDVFKVDTDGKVTASAIAPASDSITGVQITKSDKITPIINVDTTNERVEIKGVSTYGITQFIGNGADSESSIGFKDSTDTNDEAWVIGKNVGLSNTTGRFGIFYLNGEKFVITTDGRTGIGVVTPDTSAILDLTSTTKGFTTPRMTTAQRNAIVSPISGLEVYVTDGSSGKYVYNGSRWDKISNLAYLKASNVVAVNPAANTLLNFSTGVISNCIKTNMGGGRYELYPGVYELMGVQLISDNDAGMTFQFYNYTTSSYIGEKGSASDVLGSSGVSSTTFAILECTIDTQIGLRCLSDSTVLTDTTGNWLKIVQIA